MRTPVHVRTLAAAWRTQRELSEARRELERERERAIGAEQQTRSEQERVSSAKRDCESATANLANTRETARTRETEARSAGAANEELKRELERLKNELVTLRQRSAAASARSEELEATGREKDALQLHVEQMEKTLHEALIAAASSTAQREVLSRALDSTRADFARLANDVKHRECLASEKFDAALHSEQRATASEQRAKSDRVIADTQHDAAAHERMLADRAQASVLRITAEHQREASASSRALIRGPAAATDGDAELSSDGHLIDISSFTDELASGASDASSSDIYSIASVIVGNLVKRNISFASIAQQFCRMAGDACLERAEGAYKANDKRKSAQMAMALGVVTTMALLAAEKSGDARSARMACDMSSRLQIAAGAIASAATQEPNIDPNNTLINISRECSQRAAHAPTEFVASPEQRTTFINTCTTAGDTPAWADDVLQSMRGAGISPNAIIRDFCGAAVSHLGGGAHEMLAQHRHDDAIAQVRTMTAANAVAVRAVQALRDDNIELNEMCAETMRRMSSTITDLTGLLKQAADSGSRFNYALGETVANLGVQITSAAQQLVSAAPAATSCLSVVPGEDNTFLLATPERLKVLEGKHIDAPAAPRQTSYVQRGRGRDGPSSAPQIAHRDFVQVRTMAL